MYLIRFSKKAEKDKKLLKGAGLEKKTKALLDIIKINPFENPPPYEALVGNLSGYYSRRINIQHRLVYRVINEKTVVDDEVFDGTIIIARMWTHYDEV